MTTSNMVLTKLTYHTFSMGCTYCDMFVHVCPTWPEEAVRTGPRKQFHFNICKHFFSKVLSSLLLKESELSFVTT
jgi:hypothetical protein